jgi:hypothetical protein
MVENNVFHFEHVEIKVPEWHFFFSSISAVCWGQFYHYLLEPKTFKVKLRVHFKIETEKHTNSRIVIVYSMLIYSEKQS